MPAAVAMTAGEIAERLSLTLDGDGNTPVCGLNTLGEASATDVVFVADPKYLSQLADTRAGTVLMSAEHREHFSGTKLLCDSPYLAYARLSQLLYPRKAAAPGRHPTALIDPDAVIAASASIGAMAIIGAGVSIGEDCEVGAHSVLEEGVVLGAGTVLENRVVLHSGVTVGRHCVIHSGAVLGADGFGFAPDSSQAWHKIAQIGGVRVGDRVEIGANTTIDCGAIGDTVIKDGVILDNQIQIGHNVRIGENSAIAGCTGIAGSTDIGARVHIGGHSAVLGHLSIADDVVLMGHSVVSGSIRAKGVYSSVLPVMPLRVWRRLVGRFRRLDRRS